MESTTFTYKHDSSAGDITAHVHYAPASSSTSQLPIALIFHAGGFTVGSTDLIAPSQIEALVKRLGFVVVCPDYRLCPQVGLYEGPITDAKDSLDWVRRELPAQLKAHTNGAIEVDPQRVVAMGHSAGGNLALQLGAVPNPPKAIADFYGSKYLDDPFWHSPLPSLSELPDFDPNFLAKVYTDPPNVPTTTPPTFVAGKPVLTSSRNAWMLDALKRGTHLKEIVRDGDLQRCDPVSGFGAKGFPPTIFVHGTADLFAPAEQSARAVKELKEKGVDAELVSVDGQPHMFDVALKEGDELFDGVVIEVLKWLKERV